MKFLISILGLITVSMSSIAQVIDTCEVWFNDTVAYIDSKTTSIIGISMNNNNDAFFANHGYAGYAVKFEAPDTVSISGVCFYGVMDTGADGVADVKVYDGTSGIPGAVLAAASEIIPYFGTGYTGAMDADVIMHCAEFSSPVLWEGDYFVSVENHSSSDMYIARNGYGQGAAEDISFVYYEGVSDPTYDGWYQMYTNFGADWNYDPILRPVINYYARSIVSYEDSLCFGDTLNSFVEYYIDDSLMFNKFYNPNHINYNGYSEALTFNYDDMTAVTGDTFHIYQSGGYFGVVSDVDATVSTWGGTSFKMSCGFDVNVSDPTLDIANQSVCPGELVYFDAGQGFDTYLWSDNSFDDSLVVNTAGMIDGDYQYYVDVMLNGCLGSDTMTLSIGALEVNLGNDTTLCLNQNIVLDAGVHDSYDWNTGHITQTIQVGPFINDGSEEIIVEVVDGSCVGNDTIVITIANCLGIEDLITIDLDVYPNPSSDVIYLNASEEIIGLRLLTLAGKILLVKQEDELNELNLSQVSNGTYLLEVNTDKGVAYKKIQIIR